MKILTFKLLLPIFFFLIASGTVSFAGKKPVYTEFKCIGAYGESIELCEQYSHYAFVAMGYSLRVLDVKDPVHPREILWRRFENSISSLAIKWPALYIGFHDSDWLIWDVTDPAHPNPRGTFPLKDRSIEFNVLGSYLLVEGITGHNETYEVYGIRDPFKPVKFFHSNRDLRGSPSGADYPLFATDGKRLFLTQRNENDDGSHYLTVKDVTTSETTLGRTGIPCKMLVKDGKLSIVETESTVTLSLLDVGDSNVWDYEYEGGLNQIQGASKPDNTNIPPEIQAFFRDKVQAEQFRMADNRGYLVDHRNAFQVLDMSKPSRPRLLGKKEVYNGDRRSAEDPRIPQLMIRAIENDLVFLSAEDEDFYIYNCTKPTSPTLIAQYPGPSGPMSTQGKRAYVAAGDKGLLILDISNPAAIRQIGCYPTSTPASDLATSGSLVYLAAKDILIVNAADPAKPVLVSQTSTSFEDADYDGMGMENCQLKKLGAALYAIVTSKGHVNETLCKVIDVSNPAEPRVLPRQIKAAAPDEGDNKASHVVEPVSAGTTPNSGWYLCLPSHIYGTHGGWISFSESAVTMFDLSDPFNPIPVFRTGALHSEQHITMYKNKIYIPDRSGGLLIMQPSPK